ncbi:MAG: sulfatase-like hydrolase/transferase [Planctomycetota bacterium]
MSSTHALPSRPNVLWIMTDEQRCDSMGCYGSAWAKTRRLDGLARRSVTFDSAYTPSPVCVPARVAMLTGYRPSTCGVYTIHDPLPAERARFLTQNFTDAGYQTASFGKQHYNSAGLKAFDHESFRIVGDRVKPLGYVDPADEAGADMVQYPGEDASSRWVLAGRLPGTLDDMPEARVVEDARAWLGSRDPQRPFFLRVSFNGPHTPVVAPAPYDTQTDPDAIDLPIDRYPGAEPTLPPTLHRALVHRSGTHRLSDAQVRRARQVYYGLVSALDALVGRMLDTIAELGLERDTVVAFCSDHGAHLGDHGFFQKQSFFEASARVPLILYDPRAESFCGSRVTRPVSTGSLLPTLLTLCGLAVPEDVDYPVLPGTSVGSSETPGCPVVSEIAYGERGGRGHDRYVMLRDGRWKLTVFKDRYDPDRLPAYDGLMLFDLLNDPHERRDLAPRIDQDPAVRDTVKGLLDELARIDGHDAPRATPAAFA